MSYSDDAVKAKLSALNEIQEDDYHDQGIGIREN